MKMGCFDEIVYQCPRCGETNSQQTKSGPCGCQCVHINLASVDMLAGLDFHPVCHYCGQQMEISVNASVRVDLF